MIKTRLERESMCLHRNVKQNNKSKSIISWILIVTFFLSAIPLESFASAPKISIEEFNYVQETDVGKTRTKIVIKGKNFVQYIGDKEEDVIIDVTIGSGTGYVNLKEIRDAKGDVK